MAVSIGTRLGPYEILAPLGAGGMGEVYRARDPRMGREVAIKISAERFTERFSREVHAVAALNHSNICHLYDVGPNYLVMELIEGPTLADRMKQGPMVLDEALAIARQIGDALEAAHEKGIVHRDLKPANVKVKPDGTVKVLDFGLAKIAEQSAVAGSSESSPTMAMGATLAGQIMGTAAYMAPEQARGKTVDKRADIWAFGVVLYEMLTGRRLFEGETISDTLAGVLTQAPDWERVPAKARQLLRSCLEKDPKRRLRDIGDAWRFVEQAQGPITQSSRSWKVAAGVLTLTLGVAIWAPWRLTRPPDATPQAPVRLDLDLGPDVLLGSPTGAAAILSPDGTRLVLVSQDSEGTPRLLTRRLDEHKVKLLSGTEGAYAPFFSPDGQWVGFFAQGKMKKTRLDAGEPIALCDAPAGRGASWGDDGNIIAALDVQAGLSQIPSEGGMPVSITELSPKENTHRWPQVLPGGKAVLFNASAAYGNYDDAEIAVISLKDHRRKTVLEHAGMCPRYVPGGHLLYATKGMLYAASLDLDQFKVVGSGTPLEEVSSNTTVGSAQFDFSRAGTLVYRSGRTEGLRTIQWLGATGRTASFGIEQPGIYVYLRLSADGSRLAYMASQEAGTDLWVYDCLRGSKARLSSGIFTSFPVWSPDGRFVVFQAAGGMFWVRADGAGKPQALTQTKTLQYPNCFARDGAGLVFSEPTPGGGGVIRTLPVESGSGQLRAGESQLFLKTATTNTFAELSPDGRWLAYADAEAGQYEVYVRAFPDNGSKTQISNAGGIIPKWSHSRHELFYRTEDQRIMVVNYEVKGGLFVAGKPRVWFGKQLANLGVGVNLDLAPDSERFVVLMPAESAEPRENQSHVTLVVNFLDEIRRRARAQGN